VKLTMMKGLPGSGKTTAARELVTSSGNSGRINRDDLRAMLFDSVWSGKREKVVVDCEKAIAGVLFDHAMNPVVDDTNLSQGHRDMWSNVAKERAQHFEMKDMGVSIQECRDRDLLRIKSVGRAVIDRMALQQHLIDWGDRSIVLCDIDGTLANGDHRVHHVKGEKKDWKTYFSLLSDDTPIDWVVAKVRELAATHTVCIVSGRPDTYQRETLAWLAGHEVPFEWLFMRAGSDKRPDTEVKADFLRHLPKEKIALVLDDRPSVCRMWEENGLTVEWVRGRDCEEF
jgi:predicted kinase